MKPPSDDTSTTSGGAPADATAGAPSGEAGNEARNESRNEPRNEIEAFRAQELLLLRATEGLGELQRAELLALGDEDDDSYDLAAAAVDLATLPRYELPSDVAQRLLLAAGVRPPRAATQVRRDPSPAPFAAPRQGSAATSSTSSVSATSPTSSTSPASAPPSPPLQLPVLPADRPGTPFSPNGPRAVSSSGTTSPLVPRPSRAPVLAAWGVAAIAVAAAALFSVWQLRRPRETLIQRVEVATPAPQTPSPAEARRLLLTSAPDAQLSPWTLTDDPSARGASGDVVWSPSRQEGYLRFVGLAANDPKLLQYQLWIFDKLRDERYPVDGGVFDAAAVGPDGELVIKIAPALRVGQPVLFAVTVEPPGGVVVSKRERIVVTAAPVKAS